MCLLLIFRIENYGCVIQLKFTFLTVTMTVIPWLIGGVSGIMDVTENDNQNRETPDVFFSALTLLAGLQEKM